MADETTNDLVQLTAEIVEAAVSFNKMAIGDVPGLIKSVHEALAGLGAPEPVAEPEKPKGAVSARASIKPDHLISMIDGKPYKALRRHITRHGYTPETYRETFGLPDSYPMVAASYSEARRDMAKQIGLGRKAKKEVVEAPVEAVEAENPKRGRKVKEAAVEAPAVAEKAKRGRPKKAKEALADDFFDPAA